LVAPSFAWAFTVAALALTSTALLGYGIVWANSLQARYLGGADVTRITLDRTGCYGTCPAYTLSLGADGSATYEGRAFVAARGRFEAQIAPSVFLRLAAALARRGLRDPRPRGLYIADAPRTTISLHFETGSPVATPFFAGASSDDLWEAAMLIDGVAAHLCPWRRDRSAPRGPDRVDAIVSGLCARPTAPALMMPPRM
jgi:hypothetical protein